MEEQWIIFRDLKDDKHPYASTWEVSNFGNIKRNGKLVELKINNWGYYTLSFGMVHKIVAEAFIPKTEEDIKLGRNKVDHIDGNKLNNKVENLRWCTHTENVNFPLARKNQYESAKANGFKGRPPKKPVVQLDLKGNFIAEYDSVLEAGEKNHIWKGGISTVLHGKQKTAGGYIWKFKEDYENEKNKN